MVTQIPAETEHYYYMFENIGETTAATNPFDNQPFTTLDAYMPMTIPQTPDGKPAGFWRRQFQAKVTHGQKKFDWIFGVFMPLICFYFDPIVFKGSFDGKPILDHYGPFASLLCFMAIMATTASLLWGVKLGWTGAIVSGLLTVSFLVSLAIGVVLIPFSLLGMVFLIGCLGFTPLISSFIYLRNAVRAFRSARIGLEKDALISSWAATAVWSLAVPYIFYIWSK